jgi:hypothetical protein
MSQSVNPVAPGCLIFIFTELDVIVESLLNNSAPVEPTSNPEYDNE